MVSTWSHGSPKQHIWLAYCRRVLDGVDPLLMAGRLTYSTSSKENRVSSDPEFSSDPEKRISTQLSHKRQDIECILMKPEWMTAPSLP